MAPIKFLIVIIMSGELAIIELPKTVYMLSVNQKARVTQPIIPATIAPSLAPLDTKYIEKSYSKVPATT